MVLKKKKNTSGVSRTKKATSKKRPSVTKKKPPVTRKKTVSRRTKVLRGPKEVFLGKITHYFPKVRAAVVKLEAALSVGDKIKIKGHTTDFTQKIDSIQIDHAALTKAKAGDVIGLLVNSRVRRKDMVFKV